MTDQEISQLSSGDIILINRGPRSYLRTVIEGPADCHWTNGSVTVPIRRRSWSTRATTILDKHFLRTNATFTGMRAKKAMGGDELSRLIDMGFNVAKEIVRELKESADMKQRMMFWGPRVKSDSCSRISKKLTKAASEYKHLKTA